MRKKYSKLNKNYVFYVSFEKSIKCKIPVSSIHQIELFEVRNFKSFLGRGSPSPLPRPLPRSFSGFALDSGFALKSRALRALVSGFARFGPPQLLKRGGAPAHDTTRNALQLSCGYYLIILFYVYKVYTTLAIC